MQANDHLYSEIQFFSYLEDWYRHLPSIEVSRAIPNVQQCAVLSVDVTNGFCHEGPLASRRVAGIIQPITRLFQAAWDRGVRNILLIQDAHEPDAVEFHDWVPHCVRGSTQAQTVVELQALPFYNQIKTIPKNSISSTIHTALPGWLDQHPEVSHFIVVGDCTDLCTYQLAMDLRLNANARQLNRHVVVPADCVDTYDLPVEASQQVGAPPHPGDFFHKVFLYHMAMNGVDVVASIGN